MVFLGGSPRDGWWRTCLPMQEMRVPSLGQEDPLEKGMATHSSILAWRIPMDRGAWWATVYELSKESDTTEQLKTITVIWDGTVLPESQDDTELNP